MPKFSEVLLFFILELLCLDYSMTIWVSQCLQIILKWYKCAFWEKASPYSPNSKGPVTFWIHNQIKSNNYFSFPFQLSRKIWQDYPRMHQEKTVSYIIQRRKINSKLSLKTSQFGLNVACLATQGELRLCLYIFRLT